MHAILETDALGHRAPRAARARSGRARATAARADGATRRVAGSDPRGRGALVIVDFDPRPISPLGILRCVHSQGHVGRLLGV